MNDTRKRHGWAVRVVGLLVSCLACACGAADATTPVQVAQSPASKASKVTDASCAIQTSGLLAADDLPPQMATQGPPPSTSTTLGLLGNGDAAYPGYVGNASAAFFWKGLSSPSSEASVDQGWTAVNGSGEPTPGDFIPNGGPLYTENPAQVFLIAEEVSDFGSVANAQLWMSGQREVNQTNTDAKYGAGVESLPIAPQLGDDTFLFEVDKGAPTDSDSYTGAFVGDVYSDIQVRVGQLLYAISVDAAPGANGASITEGLVQQLMAKEAAACPSPSASPS
jgi:hypothetical protein